MSGGRRPAAAAAGAAKPLPLDEYRSLAGFRYALRRFLSFSERAARDAGITPSQHQLLLAIKGAPGDSPPSLGAVAEMLQLKLHSTSELVERAVAKRLVTRTADPDDHRRVLLGLTAKGSTLLEELTRVHRDEVRRFRAVMTDAVDSLT